MARFGVIFFFFIFSIGITMGQEPVPQQPNGQPPAPLDTIHQPEHPWEDDLNGHPPMFKNEPETVPTPGPALPQQIEDERLDLGNKRKMDGVFYSFSYGWQQTNVHSLNSVLRQFDFPDFDQFGVTIGAGGYKMFGAWVFGGEGHLAFYNSQPEPFYDATLSSGFGMVQGGYRLISSSSILFYPMIGLGGGVSTLKISEKPGNQINFNQYMANPGNNIDVSTGSVMVSFSLNLNYFTREVTVSGFHFGISAGYMLAFPTSGWYTFNANIEDGPNFDIGGPFIRLKFGGGRFAIQ
ncbi:MAG: hypothetical protein H0X62_11155 [Bacteroidetes bacterium]|nr:hypothetical protein [Bacteroidota bacterium]